MRPAGLVIGSGETGTAERLLMYDRAGALIVDVEISSCLTQTMSSAFDERLVSGEYSTGESERRRLVNQLYRRIQVGVVIDEDGENRTENLFPHEPVTRIACQEYCRLDKIADRLVALAAGEQLDGWIRLASIDVAADAVECLFVNDSG